jgi:hypothetical protein
VNTVRRFVKEVLRKAAWGYAAYLVYLLGVLFTYTARYLVG